MTLFAVVLLYLLTQASWPPGPGCLDGKPPKAGVPDVHKVLPQRPEAGRMERLQGAPAGFSASSGIVVGSLMCGPLATAVKVNG